MKKEALIFSMFVLGLFISGCNNNVGDEYPFSFENMVYSVIVGEKNGGENNADIHFNASYIFLEQKISYDCCAEISLSYRINEDILRIYENNNNNTLCETLCTYDIEAKINEKGINEVEVYGIKYSDWPYEFIAEEKRYSR